MTLKEKIVHGVSWSFVSRASSQLLQLAFSIALARLLGPSDFGIIAMIVVFTGFSQALADCGLNAALIHHQRLTEGHRSTVFWIQLTVGLAFSLLFLAASPLVAHFYSDPRLEPLVQLVSPIMTIQSIGYSHYALLRKDFQFRALAFISMAAAGLSGIAAVTLAFAGYGVWALVWQALIAAGTTTGLLWIQSDWRPRFIFDTRAGAELGRYGIYLLADESLNYWTRNGDNLLIGKFLGAHALGVYSLAYKLMLLPLNNIAAMMGEVLFPTLAQLQDDIPKFRRSYLAATRAIALVSFPLMAGLAVLCEPLIIVFLGEKWADVIPVLRVLSFVGLFQSTVFPTGWIFTALGQTKVQFRVTLAVSAMFVAAILLGLQYGLLGVAYAYAIWALVTGLVWLQISGRYIGLTAGDILFAVARVALMAGTMGLIVFAIDSGLSSTHAQAQRLFIGVLGGISSYLSLCWLTGDPTFLQLRQLFTDFLGRSTSRENDQLSQ